MNSYQRLALHVIGLALRDLERPAGAAEDRASARRFLEGSGMLTHWCAVAQLDPVRVERAGRLLRDNRDLIPVAAQLAEGPIS